MVRLRSPQVKSGFTLIELLIVIGITVLMSTIGLLTLVNVRANQQLRLTSENLVTFLRDAQQKSISQESGLQWGVRFTHQAGGRDSYQLISGPGFNPAGSVVTLPNGVEFASAYSDVTFAPSTGLPGAPATLIMRLTGNTSTIRTITINAQGVIQEQ